VVPWILDIYEWYSVWRMLLHEWHGLLVATTSRDLNKLGPNSTPLFIRMGDPHHSLERGFGRTNLVEHVPLHSGRGLRIQSRSRFVKKHDFSGIEAHCNCQGDSLGFTATQVSPFPLPELRVDIPLGRYFERALERIVIVFVLLPQRVDMSFMGFNRSYCSEEVLGCPWKHGRTLGNVEDPCAKGRNAECLRRTSAVKDLPVIEDEMGDAPKKGCFSRATSAPEDNDVAFIYGQVDIAEDDLIVSVTRNVPKLEQRRLGHLAGRERRMEK